MNVERFAVQDEVLYSVVEASSSESELFYLNPATGVVSLSAVWPRLDKQEYRVSAAASWMSHNCRLRQLEKKQE